MRNPWRLAALFTLALSWAPASHAQNLNPDRIKDLASTIQQWASAPTVVAAIKAQNTDHAGLSQADIDGLDTQWRAETEAPPSPLIDGVLGNDLSAYLSKVKDGADGLYAEIFVMDNKGLNVGQSDVTSDYWQGDEAKFQQSFGAGPDAMHLSDVEFDESSQTYLIQMSLPINDGGAPIGAVTVGLNAEALQ
ncbi:MAG: PDC sensor domain-containing protein [Rhodospirillum sp.]|nr:PDC sensor domain-containing protein [Rhodospirillum sp.]MCF8489876.1 PDC sensor domain-containing protein [Rhodospirillum sp.]MCF8499439.1 PDC sensor domain-containing protein [Rhodospirillum sp.]